MKYANTIVSALTGAALIITLTASSASSTESSTQHAVVAPSQYSVSPAVISKKKKSKCKNVLAQRLHRAGFRGNNLREAWAIAMRESGGNPKSISSTRDFGVFQFNEGAWHRVEWWNPKKLLTAEYNIGVAYRMSKGGKTWYPWDIGGKGQHLARYTSGGTYAVYKKWYRLYPC